MEPGREVYTATHSTTLMVKMSSGTSIKVWQTMMTYSFHPCFRLHHRDTDGRNDGKIQYKVTALKQETLSTS